MSEKINDMFSRISTKYDRMNDLLSFGIHRLWRKKAVRKSEVKTGFRVLDCASGTGDLAVEHKKAVGDTGYVLATDFNSDMLAIASQKFAKKNLNIEIEIADVLNLKYDDNSFDVSCTSFGIRNVDSPSRCLEEMARVVRTGGKVVVLEIGQPRGLFSIVYKFYSKFLIPLLGKIIASDGGAYNYLHDSTSKFPCREKFTDIMESTGKFSDIKYYSLTFGIAYLYIGKVK